MQSATSPDFKIFRAETVLSSRTREEWPRPADFRVSALFWQVFGHGTGRKRFGTAVGFIWVDSRGLATFLDPFRAILVILGPTPYLRRQQSELLGQDRLLLFQQRGSVLLKQDRCLLLRKHKCLSSSHLACLNSRHLSCLSRRHLSCLKRRSDSCRPPAGCCYVFC